MRITVLDGYTLNPVTVLDGCAPHSGDIGWEGIKNLCSEFNVYERTTDDEIVRRAEKSDILIINKTPITKEILDQLPKLKYISVMATGYNVVDITAAKEKNIVVTNVAGYSTASVVQHTLALILELSNSVRLHSEDVKKGKWVQSKDFCYTLKPVMELADKNLGIIGFGTIGKAMAKMGNALGMNILISSKHIFSHEEYEVVPLKELFSRSDVISLHASLTSENEKFVDRDLISMAKPSAYIINTGRGSLIEEQDLADALNGGKIAGAALDVLSTEPPKAENPLLKAKNCTITPHIAWASYEARKRLMDMVIKNIQCFLAGNPQNVITGT